VQQEIDYRPHFQRKSLCFATLWQLRTLDMSSEYIYISFQSCQALFFKHTVCVSGNEMKSMPMQFWAIINMWCGIIRHG
jgi:hypothetical protein